MAFRFKLLPRLFQPISARFQPSGIRFSHSPVSKTSMASITTPPAGKIEWLVIIPDKPGTQEKRLEVRAQHFAGLQPFIQSQQFKTGGAIFNSKPESDNPADWDWAGSTIVVVAESKEEVKKIIAEDIYSKSGVWDPDNAQIYAAKFAFRFP